MVKKGYFFTLDAIISLILLFSVLSLVGIYYLKEEENFQQIYYSSDVMNILSTIKLSEINISEVKVLLNESGVEDKDITVIEQIARFYVAGDTINKKRAKNFSEILTEKLIPKEFGWGLWLRGSSEPIYLNGTFPERSAITSSQMVSGVQKERPVKGYTAKVFIKDINERKSSVYIYFGGYVGDGNITKKFFLPETVEVTNVSIELDAGNDFTLLINDATSGNYTINTTKKNLSAERWSIDKTYMENFVGGENNITLLFNSTESKDKKGDFIGGGYIKIELNTPEIGEYKTGKRKYYLPGIKGIINLYDSFYVPGNLSNLSAYLHFKSNRSIFFNIGAKRVFNSTEKEEEQEVYLNDSYLREKINYTNISLKTVPIRLGLEEMVQTKGGGSADIVFLIDTTASMGNEIKAVKDIIEDFADVLENSSIDYRLALIEFKDYPEWACGDYTDFPYYVHPLSNMKIDSTEEWENGNFTNVTAYNSFLMLKQNGTIGEERRDQVQEIISTIKLYVYGIRWGAQTFMPAVNGSLRKVRLRLYKRGNPGPIVVEIRNTTDGHPTEEIIASVERDDIERNIEKDYDFIFPQAPNLTIGKEYSIVIKVKNNQGNFRNYYYTFPYYEYPGGPYPQGAFYSSYDGGVSWNLYEHYDLYFVTYMRGEYYHKHGFAINQYNSSKIIKWGSFESSTYTSDGTSVSWEFRSSNDSKTWSDWYGNIENVPKGKYLQQKAILSSDGLRTPAIDWTRVTTGEFTRNVTVFKNAVAEMTAVGGADWPESHLSAINESLFLEYRENTDKINIMLSDAPPHARDCIWHGAPTYKVCYKGPEYVRNMIDALVSEDITFFYINNRDTSGLCDNKIMAENMTNETGGKYYEYIEASEDKGVKNIILEIAKKIINITYKNQTVLVKGINASTVLFPDSYIEFNYTPAIKVSYGMLPVTIETPRFNNEITEGKFEIPQEAEIYDVKLTSYSAEMWTKLAKIKDIISGSFITFYNLSEYNTKYLFLGDPYLLNIPVALVQKGENTVVINLGSSSKETSGGSIDDRAIYTIGVPLYLNYSGIYKKSEGCLWQLKFEDNSISTINIPSNYSGSGLCLFTKDTDCDSDFSDDAINNAACHLFEQLDLDNDGKLIVAIDEDKIETQVIFTRGAPYMWGPSLVEARVWR